MEMMILFSIRTWHLPTLPKVPKAGSMTMLLLCLIGQHTRLTWTPWRIYGVLSRGRGETPVPTMQMTWTKQQIKLRWALFITYTIIQRIMRSEMCSLHLTHPSAHTWSGGQPTVLRPGSSWGLPAGARIRTHNLGLPRVSSPTLYPLEGQAEGRYQSNLGFHYTWAVPQADCLHATPHWCSNSCKRRPNHVLNA